MKGKGCCEDVPILDRRVVILEPGYVKDAYGQERITLNILHRTWGMVKYPKLRYSEDQVSKQETARTLVEITIRWKQGITEKEVVEYDGNQYNIKTIAEVGRREYLELICELKR